MVVRIPAGPRVRLKVVSLVYSERPAERQWAPTTKNVVGFVLAVVSVDFACIWDLSPSTQFACEASPMYWTTPVGVYFALCLVVVGFVYLFGCLLSFLNGPFSLQLH